MGRPNGRVPAVERQPLRPRDDERSDPEGAPRHAPVRCDADRRHARGRARLSPLQPARSRTADPTSTSAAATSTSSCSRTARPTSISVRVVRARVRRGKCPYNKTATSSTSSRATQRPQPVKTYVIGFSVNGAGDPNIAYDGFPAAAGAIKNCKPWYPSFPAAAGVAMHAACTPPAATVPPQGSTADACCKLNEIAYWGTGLRTTSGRSSQRRRRTSFSRSAASSAACRSRRAPERSRVTRRRSASAASTRPVSSSRRSSRTPSRSGRGRSIARARSAEEWEI